MLQRLRFQPLVDDGKANAEDRWQMQFTFDRLGEQRFGSEGTVIFFAPLPPMWTDLEAPQQLPPLEQACYTLVLDLDETLIHSMDENGEAKHPMFSVRPGMSEFIETMSGLGYEIVVFTTATQDYADYIIDQIDSHRLIHHRLYRQHTLPWGPVYIKDLSRLGRSLDQTLIIDNLADNFLLQPDHGITIKSWYDDPHDQALYNLTPLLAELVNSNARVPDILRKYADEVPVWADGHPNSIPMRRPSQRCQQPIAAQCSSPFAATFVPIVMQTQPMMMFTTSGVATGPVMQFAQSPMLTDQDSYQRRQDFNKSCEVQEHCGAPLSGAMSPPQETQKSKRLVNRSIEKRDSLQSADSAVVDIGVCPSAQVPAQPDIRTKPKGLKNKALARPA